MDIDKEDDAAKKAEEEEKKKKKEQAPPEPNFEVKQNPARVTVPQLSYVKFERDPEARYHSVREGQPRIGVTILVDTKPNEPVKLVKQAAAPGAPGGAPGAPGAGAAGGDDEPAPPKPFEFQDDE